MQDYTDFAEKNGVELLNSGSCQFCGAETERGVHECVEIFSLGFNHLDYSNSDNHTYRFISVDAHTLQHPEIHGRWNNHFHLSRQHLMFHYKVKWNYSLSPKLSAVLKSYKAKNADEVLEAPEIGERGNCTAIEVLLNSKDELSCRDLILNWGFKVYEAWYKHHSIVDRIALSFLKENDLKPNN